MKLMGAKKLSKQLGDLPDEVRSEIAKVIRRNTEAGARLARQLVPVASGQLKGWIHTKYDNNGLRGSVEAAPDTADAQIKAKSVEGGATRADRGQTAAAPYMNIMKSHLAKRHRNNVQRAITKAARKVLNG
jgi:transposase-like protein